jgi:hypothetical protein
MVCYKIGQHFQCRILLRDGGFVGQVTTNNWLSGRWFPLTRAECEELRQALREKDMVKIEEIIE